MERYIPPSVTDALKQGFSAPDASWFKGESIEYVRRILHGKNTRLYDYMAREAVDGLVNEHLQGKTNRRLFIWSLIAFELWLRSYLA
jgi:asparagine synthase (glutamine-hydrolysing)